MPGETEICNMALAMVGAENITSLDDPVRQAALCKLFYPNVRDAMLEEYIWSFALDRLTLTAATVNSEWGPEYRYQIPTDVLVVHRVYSDVTSERELVQNRDWKLEGSFIITTYTPIYAHVLKRVVSPSAYTNTFIQALTARLAAELCIPLTENATLQANLWSIYQTKLSDAVATDGRQGAREEYQTADLVKVRY